LSPLQSSQRYPLQELSNEFRRGQAGEQLTLSNP